MKIALVHDWLTGMRGGEKCLEVFCELFPEADVYTLVHFPCKISGTINRMPVKTSFLQRMPLVEKTYRYYLPLMPKMMEGFYLEGYDLVLSSSHCVAKGIRIKPGTKHICYCFTPMRYIWDLYEDYFKEASLPSKLAIRVFLNYLRKWDMHSAGNVDNFIAISKYVKERIGRIYNRDSVVIYPPVDTEKYNYKRSDVKKEYFFLAGAFAAYKRVDLVVNVFNKIKSELLIAGSGQEFRRIKSMAKSNVRFLGWVSDEDLRKYYSEARALIFPSDEDFGIVPVEAMACGTPVIAYAKGGALETVVDKETGLFFGSQSEESLADAIERFEMLEFSREKLRESALKFSKDRFKEEISKLIIS